MSSEPWIQPVKARQRSRTLYLSLGAEGKEGLDNKLHAFFLLVTASRFGGPAGSVKWVSCLACLLMNLEGDSS